MESYRMAGGGGSGLFYTAELLSDSSKLLQIQQFISFLSLSSLPLNGYSTIYLSITLLMDIGALFSF